MKQEQLYNTLFYRFKKLQREVSTFSSDIEERVLLDSKTIRAATNEQMELETEVSRLFSKAYALQQYANESIEEIYHSNFTEAITNSYRKYSATEAKSVALSEPKYLKHKKMYNRINALFQEVKELKDLVETRKYSIKNFTDATIHGINTSLF